MKKIYKVQFGTIKRELLTYNAKKLRDIFDKSYFYDNYMRFYKETGTMFVTLNDNNIAKEILSGIEFKCFFWENRETFNNDYFSDFVNNGAILMEGNFLETKDDYKLLKNYINNNLDSELLNGKLNWIKENSRIDMEAILNKLIQTDFKKKSK